MLGAIKHVADGNFVSQQDSTVAHCARNTIQLPQREIINLLFLSCGAEQPVA